MFNSIWANHPLRVLLLGQVPADFADWVDFIAVTALLAFAFQADTYWFALLGLAMAAPYIVIGPWMGALVDRWDLRGVLIYANLGRAVVTFGFILAATPAILLLLVAIRSAVDSAFGPAKQAAIQALTPRDDLVAANGVSHTINQASKVLGPTIGGGLLAVMAPQYVFALNGCISLLSLLAFVALPRQMRPLSEGDGDRPGLWVAIRQNASDTRANPVVWRLILLMAAGYVAMFIYDTFHAPLFQSFGLNPTVLGISIAAVGAGGIVGALAVMRAPETWSAMTLIGFGSITGGSVIAMIGAFGLFGAGLPGPVMVTAYFVTGFFGAAMFVPFRTALQKAVPKDNIAKVFALSEAFNTVGMLAAPFLGAVLAAVFGFGAAFVAGGLLAVLIGAIAICQRL